MGMKEQEERQKEARQARQRRVWGDEACPGGQLPPGRLWTRLPKKADATKASGTLKKGDGACLAKQSASQQDSAPSPGGPL